MNKYMKERRKSIFITAIGGFLGFVLIITSVVSYARSEYKSSLDQAGIEMSQVTMRSAETIEFFVDSGQSQIQNIAIGVSNVMGGEEIQNPNGVLEPFVENSIFENIEYIRANGMNMTSAGEPFDASDRVYYKEGIKGRTGVFVNFAPKYSDEPLMNFYTPLYYDNKIVGVLTGTIGGNQALKEFLVAEYLGENVFGLVVDEDNYIIASTMEFEKGTQLKGEGVDDKYREDFLKAVKKADGARVNLGGKYDNTICVVQEVKNTKWRIVQIIPSVSIHEITNLSETRAMHAVEGILLVSVLFFGVVIYLFRRVANMNLHEVEDQRDEQLRVITSVSDMYHSMHVLDLVKDEVTEYKAEGVVKEIIAKGQGAIVSMKEVVAATITDAYLDIAYEFSDLTTLAERMQGKVFTYQDMLGQHVGWVRFYFITLEKDIAQRPVKVIIATQVIDEEKKREQELLRKSNSDELTGLLNRRSYEERIQALAEAPTEEDLVYISMDVNGLKQVNDNLGHVAGDELIRGAASCMSACLKKYGQVYRTGGDEFIAILHVPPEEENSLKETFEATVNAWKGQLVEKLTVSSGYVAWREVPELAILEVAKLADERMYLAKSMYYKKKGVDRRGLASAQTALISLYKKILKINITEDSHMNVNVNAGEMVESMGYSEKISQWFKQFALSGNVHEDDRENFLAKTDLEFMKDYFAKGNEVLIIHYRRKQGDGYTQVFMEIIPADDYSPDNQSLFLYVRDVAL